ncbi:MAG: penicillin-binding protein activator LpoB [Paludibacter sp.]|nr:penicillin-binding protein activator LpoB [Paludibacter sp.]
MKPLKTGLFLILSLIVCSLSCYSQNAEATKQVLKRKVAIARFSNETQYAKGAFYDKANDPMAKQALDILSTKLALSEKFLLLERGDIEKVYEELKASNGGNTLKVGADYLIIGSITEFGRKNQGDAKVFSQSKTQVVYAGVSIRLIDVATGMIIYSEEAKGEAETKSKTVLGYGSTVDYDASLNDKALTVAISQLVENIINNCMERAWRSYFLNYDENGIIISGGKSQGLAVGNTFAVFEKGKSVKNPQTGMMIELPGKRVAGIKINFVGGENAQNEFAMVDLTDGTVDKEKLENYYITENK